MLNTRIVNIYIFQVLLFMLQAEMISDYIKSLKSKNGQKNPDLRDTKEIYIILCFIFLVKS